MSKLKLKLKKHINEKLSLVEHVNITNATYIGTGNGYDVFDIRTFAAMQEFYLGNSNNACNFTNGQAEFDSHIVNGTMHLYLFARQDTNRVFGAAIHPINNQNIKYNDSHSYLISNVAYESNEGTSNNIPAEQLIPLHLIPGSHFELHADASDRHDLLVSLATIGNIPVPENTEHTEEPEAAVEPADEPVTTTEEPTDEPTAITTEIPDAEDIPSSTEEVPAAETSTVETPEAPITSTSPDITNVYQGIFRYKVVKNEVYITHIKVTAEMKSNHTITIPDTIEDKPVTKLWKYCLTISDNTYNTWSIYCGNNLKEIKNYAILATPLADIALRNFHGIKYTYSIYRMEA